MLSLTTHIAAKYPELLEGPYETRREVLNSLTVKTGSLLGRKSRRLANMNPEQIDLLKIKSKKEREQLMISMNNTGASKQVDADRKDNDKPE